MKRKLARTEAALLVYDALLAVDEEQVRAILDRARVEARVLDKVIARDKRRIAGAIERARRCKARTLPSFEMPAPKAARQKRVGEWEAAK